MTSATLHVTINGKDEELPDGLTVAALLERRGVHNAMVAVEHNGHILRRAQFAEAQIAAGDKLEIVHFVGGG